MKKIVASMALSVLTEASLRYLGLCNLIKINNILMKACPYGYKVTNNNKRL